MAIKIYVDQGHNPRNPNSGAEGNGYLEQNIVYEIGLRLAELLKADGRFDVKLSRPSKSTQLGTSNSTSLIERVRQANEWGADYFISLHTNASEISSANGSESLVYKIDSDAGVLGGNILVQLTDLTGFNNRGVKPRPGLYVLRRTKMPAVLVELGFISNSYEATLMATRPDLFALGVFNGILAYLGYL